MRFFFLIFLFFSLFCNARVLPLKGLKCDYLIDLDRRVLLCDHRSFSLKKMPFKGYLFVYGKELYCLKGNVVSCEERKWTLDFNREKILLPDTDDLVSIQNFVLRDFLFLPEKDGFAVYRIGQFGRCGFLKTSFEITGNILVFPRIFLKNDFTFLKHRGYVEVFKNFKKIKTIFPSPHSIQFFLSVGEDFFSILTVEKPGGVFSIFTRVISYDYEFNKVKELKRDCFAIHVFPLNGDFVYDKKDVSIFSLFGGKKIYFERTFMKRGRVKDYSFSLSSKRRHLYFLRIKNKICVLAQCKDGKVFLLDLNKDKRVKLNGRFYYEYDFLRGKKGGIFFEEDGDRYIPVRFNCGLFPRFF